LRHRFAASQPGHARMLEILAGFGSEKASCVRQPVQHPMAVAEGNAGKLPTTQRGLEIFRKESDHTNPAPAGVAVTAFGQNPDGKGTLLRLWEYAGKSGLYEVRLPSGLRPASVQTVDLRGRLQSEPIPVKDGIFVVNVRAFSPVTVLSEAR
jgi:alpha-mannosidase